MSQFTPKNMVKMIECHWFRFSRCFLCFFWWKLKNLLKKLKIKGKIYFSNKSCSWMFDGCWWKLLEGKWISVSELGTIFEGCLEWMELLVFLGILWRIFGDSLRYFSRNSRWCSKNNSNSNFCNEKPLNFKFPVLNIFD